jgi:hypothetical protein
MKHVFPIFLRPGGGRATILVVLFDLNDDPNSSFVSLSYIDMLLNPINFFNNRCLPKDGISSGFSKALTLL